MDGLERLAGNPVADKGIAGVLRCNPTGYHRTVALDLPDSWFAAPTAAIERTYRASRMAYENRPWRVPGPDERRRRFGSIDPRSRQVADRRGRRPSRTGLPAPADARDHPAPHVGARAELRDRRQPRKRHRPDRVAVPRADLRSGVRADHPASSTRATGREVLRPPAGMDLLSFVRERPDPLDDGTRRAFYQRNLDREMLDGVLLGAVDADPRTRRAPARLHGRAAARTGGPSNADSPRREPESLIQRIGLDATDPVIRIDIEVDLAGDSEPQGVYFGLPLAMDAGWRAAFDTAGQPVDPRRRAAAGRVPGVGHGSVGGRDVGRAGRGGAAHPGRAAGPVRRVSTRAAAGGRRPDP